MDIFMAAYRGDIEKMEELLKSGEGIEKQDSTGWTPLMYACKGGHLNMVHFLLEKGADVNATTTFYRTALMIACLGGSAEIVKLLLKSGANVNFINSSTWNALTYACVNDRLNVAKLLLQNGSKVHMGAEEGEFERSTGLCLVKLDKSFILLFLKYQHLLDEEQRVWVKNTKYKANFKKYAI